MNCLDAVVLLGWMPCDVAVRFLRKECGFDPALTEDQAKALWQKYRDVVDSLDPRVADAPVPLPLNSSEKQRATKFLEHWRKIGAQNILDVIKIDPMKLIVHQLYVVTDHANDYVSPVGTIDGWMDKAVSVGSGQHQLQIRSAPNAIDVDLPHGEFGFGFIPNRGFQIQEWARHVSVTAFNGRMLLWAGYHRSYARMCNAAPDAIERSLPMVLTTDGVFTVSPTSPNQGLRDMLCGPRPPIFADFFDERFFIRAPLRKKRYELQIRATLVAVNV